MEVLSCHPRFLEKIKKTRSDIDIPQGGFASDDDSKDWYEKVFSDDGSLSVYNSTISEIASDFNLASNFIPAIEMFLVFNKMLAPDSTFISMKYNETLGQKELRVQVFGETRHEDWRRIWGTIKKLQKNLPGHNPGRFRTKTNFMAEKIAYKMKRDKFSYEDIAEVLREKGFGEQHDNIGKLIHSFKKRLKRFDR